MSNQYLLRQMVLNREMFFQRLKRFYDVWKNPETELENDAMSNVHCMMVAVGDDYGSEYNKSVSFHIWLFGYELNDTICVFTRHTVYILSGEKEIEFLKPIESRMDVDGNDNKPAVKLLVCDRDRSDDDDFTKLLNVMSQNGKPIGVIDGDGFPGEFGESWEIAMAKLNFRSIDIGASIAHAMAVKDELELIAIKEACTVSINVFDKYLKPHIAEIIKAKKRVKHSRLAKCVEHALSNKNCVFDTDTFKLGMCYPPMIQSGGNYDLKFTAGSDQKYLDSGVIVCSFGVRYRSYCVNFSRTLLVKPSNAIQSNYDLVKELEKELLEGLIPGARLNEVYESALEYVKRVKPDLVEHLQETFGSAIGIEFDERSLTIGPKCMAAVRKGMVFNLCVGLNGLTDSHDGKSYALLHSNTVIVNESGAAKILTSHPAYLKLNADCWEHIFDYLSYGDILKMAKTCIRMHRIAGYYIRKNFRQLQYDLDENKVKVSYMLQTFHLPAHFWRFIEHLYIGRHFNIHLKFEQFSSLTTLSFYQTALNETIFGYIHDVLQNIQNIKIDYCTITDTTFEQLQNLCPKLKCLQMSWCNNDFSTAIFQQHFPLLEHFEYEEPTRYPQFNEAQTFFERHKNLKRFKCDDKFLWSNRDLFNEKIIQLSINTISMF